jgi:hypothetical protein
MRVGAHRCASMRLGQGDVDAKVLESGVDALSRASTFPS